MNIEEHIQILTNANPKLAYQSLKELLQISEQSNLVYPYFDCFIEMMRDNNNSYIRTRGLRLIAYNAKWNIDHKVDIILPEFLKHIEDEKPITARGCIQDCIILAKYKSDAIDLILKR